MLEVVRIPVWSFRGTVLSISFLLAIGFFAYRAYAHCQSSHLEKQWDGIRPYPVQLTASEDRLTLLSASLRWSPLNSRAHYLKALSMEAGSARAGLFEFTLRQSLMASSETQILEAIRLEPANATYWALLGRLEAARQNFEISRFAFENALDLARTDGFIHRDFGIALIQQGDVRHAASRFLLARTYAPIIALEELLELLGRRTGDRTVWESIVKYEPSDLRIYADFLGRRSLPDLRAQFLKQAEALERKQGGVRKSR